MSITKLDISEALALAAPMRASNSFVASLFRYFQERGTLTDNQFYALRKMVEPKDVPAAAPVAYNPAHAQAQANDMDVSRIHAMFDKARSSGLKRPKFRADGLTISLAPDTGMNAGALYVKHDETYLGKIKGGRFMPVAGTPSDIAPKLREIAVDPMGVAVKYGKLTGCCSCCGRTLTAAESVEAGIGPICSANFGM